LACRLSLDGLREASPKLNSVGNLGSNPSPPANALFDSVGPPVFPEPSDAPPLPRGHLRHDTLRTPNTRQIRSYLHPTGLRLCSVVAQSVDAARRHWLEPFVAPMRQSFAAKHCVLDRRLPPFRRDWPSWHRQSALRLGEKKVEPSPTVSCVVSAEGSTRFRDLCADRYSASMTVASICGAAGEDRGLPSQTRHRSSEQTSGTGILRRGPIACRHGFQSEMVPGTSPGLDFALARRSSH
jgi:hypothetical protein